MKRKAVSLMFLVLSSFLVLTACSSDEEGSGDDEKVVEFMHLWPEGNSTAHYNIVNDIVEEFESENPGVKVELEVLSNEQYKDKIKVLSSSNELPDVGMTWAAGYMEPFIEGDQFASLNDILDGEFGDLFVPGTVDAYSFDEEAYGLPLELNIAPVFYNQAIFEEHGLEAPETYDDFLNIVDVLTENDVAPIALGNKDAWTGSLWYMYLADRIGGPTLLTDAINGDANFTDDAFVNAANEIQSLVDKGAFVKGFNGLGDQEAKSMFMNEQAAMYLIGSWDLPNYTTSEDVPQEFRDSIDYFKFPTVDGNGDVDSFVGGPGVGLFVSENSEVKDEAKAFVQFFVEQWGEEAVQEAGVIPATKVDTDEVDLHQMYIDVLDDLSNASNITLFADVQMSPDAAQKHLDLIQGLFGAEVTPEEFAEEHEKAME
ncbi:extracellular solute-binding protein [Piscibacillus halophilus]|uniref:Carbohydrate ABC transporter substrate-binding protein, CUT1 family n=1 Tax=Piscibacillus halophilus TaxID=571933 RepID=A0A1H9HUC0_9BACI|nr:extracellular solute-binding protein [Piscibacillus halophilus]SEQ65916.1 carbohydrate ABC transporter substrate-binding protein, CUT1 family [Piscibacillus halophilus]